MEKARYLSICFTDFDEIWHSDASGTSATCRSIKLTEFENPAWRLAAKKYKMAYGQHLENCNISAAV